MVRPSTETTTVNSSFSVAKAVVGTVATAAIVTAGLALGAKSGKFAVTTEMAPPKGTDLSHLIKCAKPLVGRVHAANVTDFQSAVMRTTSLATCKVLKDVGLEPVLQMTGRDRNRIAIQGEMLSAGVFGIKNMLALTGDHTVVGDHPQAKGVFDLDCISILQTAETLMSGKDLVGNEDGGILCSPYKTEEFTNAILKLCKDSELYDRYSKRNKEFANFFDVESVKNQLEKIYKEF
jgi:5,10-methylenetetrahydrofolate reductase